MPIRTRNVHPNSGLGLVPVYLPLVGASADTAAGFLFVGCDRVDVFDIGLSCSVVTAGSIDLIVRRITANTAVVNNAAEANVAAEVTPGASYQLTAAGWRVWKPTMPHQITNYVEDPLTGDPVIGVQLFADIVTGPVTGIAWMRLRPFSRTRV